MGNVARPRGDLAGMLGVLASLAGTPTPVWARGFSRGPGKRPRRDLVKGGDSGPGRGDDLESSGSSCRGLGFGRCGGGLSRWTFRALGLLRLGVAGASPSGASVVVGA